MSYMALNVFMPRADVIKRYRMPRHLHTDLFKEMPVATVQNGKPVYLESQVDAFLRERFPHPTPIPYQKVMGARPRGGRRVTTDHEALFAIQMKKEGKTMKQIVKAMKEKWPERAEDFNISSVGKTIWRYECRQSRQSNSP